MSMNLGSMRRDGHRRAGTLALTVALCVACVDAWGMRAWGREAAERPGTRIGADAERTVTAGWRSPPWLRPAPGGAVPGVRNGRAMPIPTEWDSVFMLIPTEPWAWLLPAEMAGDGAKRELLRQERGAGAGRTRAAREAEASRVRPVPRPR